LENGREDRFISGEVWVRHAFGNGADIMVDYTRSRANSNEDAGSLDLGLNLFGTTAGAHRLGRAEPGRFPGMDAFAPLGPAV
jgi:hypothetical protein